MSLSNDRIKKLASRKGVKSIAVENFLGSIFDLSYREALCNLKMDAGLYRWNAATQKAIRDGLAEHFH